ncbi:MAG TPA: hypothetical protein VEB65_03825 [Solirubrobacterales bacterium]|nr:hypothetical protein [Solirubrobacterales bacterium]
MSFILSRRWRGASLAAVAVLGTACSDMSPTEPQAPSFSSSSGPTLVECPTDATRSKTGTIGLLGGTISLDGHSISLPFGAVLLPVSITLTVPASQYMEVDITANGLEHFEFLKPVDVTISYGRCTRTDIDHAPLSVWYIDSSTKALLEDMGGVDDKTARTVTFGTGHLSGYSIAQ